MAVADLDLSPGVVAARTAELTTLVTAVREGHRLALVDGEVGVGKTWLVRKLLRQTALAGHTVLEGHCLPGRATPACGAMVELLAGAVDPLRESSPALPPITGALGPLLPELRDLLSLHDIALSAPIARHQVFRALEAGDQSAVLRTLEHALDDAELPVAAKEELVLRLSREVLHGIATPATIDRLHTALRDWPLTRAAHGEPRMNLVPRANNLRWLAEAEQVCAGTTDSETLAALRANRITTQMQVADPAAWQAIEALPQEHAIPSVRRQLGRTYLICRRRGLERPFRACPGAPGHRPQAHRRDHDVLSVLAGHGDRAAAARRPPSARPDRGGERGPRGD